jgi:hypothetical protein
METIRGRTSLLLDRSGLTQRIANYKRVLLDLGTGDGRYVQTLAQAHPDWFIIGVDACRENMYARSQAKLQNMLFVIASAQSIPPELNGLISHISINFPWGSLLDSLLRGDPKLMCGLEVISRSATSLELRLNAGAMTEAGTSLEAGAKLIQENMTHSGWDLRNPYVVDSRGLKSFPSTWAKRLAYGRDPRAIVISGVLAI